MSAKIVELEEGQSVVLVVNGKVVTVVEAKPVRENSIRLYDSNGDAAGYEMYKVHEFVGMGVTVDNGTYSNKFIGSCATTMAVTVPDASVESFVNTAFDLGFEVSF